MTRVTEEPREATPAPPVTGNPEIDAALAAVDLSGPVADHHEQLSRAHEVLQRTLNADRP